MRSENDNDNNDDNDNDDADDEKNADEKRHVSRGGCVLPGLHSYTINTLHDDDDEDEEDKDEDGDDDDEDTENDVKGGDSQHSAFTLLDWLLKVQDI